MRAPVVEHFYIGDLAEIELSSPKQGNVSRRKNQGFFYKKKISFLILHIRKLFFLIVKSTETLCLQ